MSERDSTMHTEDIALDKSSAEPVIGGASMNKTMAPAFTGAI
jgi:hypothetical protein